MPACEQLTLIQSKKRGLRIKLNVCTLDTQIKRSELRISHSKVFSSEFTSFQDLPYCY